MSDMLQYVMFKACMAKTINHIEAVFIATQHNYSSLQCQKMNETLFEARNLLANLSVRETQSLEDFLAFGNQIHDVFEKLKQY